jgi:hypothetical protein
MSRLQFAAAAAGGAASSRQFSGRCWNMPPEADLTSSAAIGKIFCSRWPVLRNWGP